MGERGTRRGAGAPFYAPLRRKTSAEIISEARAAIYGEMNGTSNAAGGGVLGQGAGLRALKTRRPYTPREPERSLFTERSRKNSKNNNRPTSGFDVKFLSLSESGEENLVTLDSRLSNLHEDALEDTLGDTHNLKKKPQIRVAPRPSQPQSMERTGDSWSGFPKLPHLSGRSKPLHRRNTTGQAQGDNVKSETALAQTISVIRPLGDSDIRNESNQVRIKSSSAEINTKRSNFSGGKSSSCDAAAGGGFNDISVKHLAVQMPNTSNELHENMSLLELSEALSRNTRDTERTLDLIAAVTRCIEKSAAPPGGSLRDLLARALFSHAEHYDDEVLVGVARALLTMRVTGPHLAAACKLVFKIAKNDKNDHFFRDTNLLELLVEGCARAEPVREGACCVYGGAALRVLALEPALAARATRAGALHLAALHLQIINNHKAENPRLVDDQCTHALYQVTGALRSLATVIDEFAGEFVSSGALRELVAALTLHTDRDVLTNVARCLSVVSGAAACCAALAAGGGAARGVLRALAACGARAPLAVRLAYTLGNMAADHERARNDIYNEEGSIDVLLTILESYTARSTQGTKEVEQDPDLHLIDTDLAGSDGSDEDVLIKTVRVLANVCLSERAGRGVADVHADRTVRALAACLQLADNIVQREMSNDESANVAHVERGEELATAALATLNNVTFYREPPDPPDTLHLPYDNICRLTCRWVRERGARSAASCEAVRALGNMSRAPHCAQLVALEGLLDALEPFLMHENVCVRCAAAGVLVNVCGAGGAGDAGDAGGAGAGAARVAARALVWSAARGDPAPAPLLARALWNAHAHYQHPLEPAQASRVAAALTLFIDDESAFEACQASNTLEQETPDEAISKNHVTFEVEERGGETAYKGEGAGGGECELSDLGYEEGDADECSCASCSRLAHWEQLVAVAVPLLDRMKPARCDAAVGTD